MTGETHLVVKTVDHIVGVEGKDEDHRCGHPSSQSTELLASHRDVNENPEDESRTKLVKRLDVEVADGRVEFTAHPELSRKCKRRSQSGGERAATHVVKERSRVANERQELALSAIIASREDVDALDDGHEKGGRYETGVVVVEEREGFCAVGDDVTGHESEGQEEGGER